MFRGRFVHTLDSKGRVSIPSGFRLELQRRSERAPILTNADQCLLLYPYEDWCDFEQRIVGLSSFDPDVQAFARMMISGVSDRCPGQDPGAARAPGACAARTRGDDRRRGSPHRAVGPLALRRRSVEDPGSLPRDFVGDGEAGHVEESTVGDRRRGSPPGERLGCPRSISSRWAGRYWGGQTVPAESDAPGHPSIFRDPAVLPRG